MRTMIRGIAAAALTMAASVSVAADPVNDAQWQRRSITLGFHQSIADLSNCMFASLAAASTWNAVGANFYIQTDTVNLQPRVREQVQAFNLDNITVADDEGAAGNRPVQLMSTQVSRTIDNLYITNADVYIPLARIRRMEYNCAASGGSSGSDPLNTYDWESGMLHELGHAVGFQLNNEYLDSTTCAMYYSIPKGVKRRVLCDGEKQEYISAYGYLFDIVSIPTATGKRGNTPIPVQVNYRGSPKFPVKLKLDLVDCGNVGTCKGDLYTFNTSAPSPLIYPFGCTGTASSTSTTRWRTTLTDANGVATSTVEHTVICTANN